MRNKLMIISVKKMMIFLKKVEFRLTIKNSKKKIRLRRHLSGHFLKKV